MIVSYNIYSLLWKTLTKGDIMKKITLLIALSVLLYSAPGNAMPGGEADEAAKKAPEWAKMAAAESAAWQAAAPVTAQQVAQAKKDYKQSDGQMMSVYFDQPHAACTLDSLVEKCDATWKKWKQLEAQLEDAADSEAPAAPTSPAAAKAPAAEAAPDQDG